LETFAGAGAGVFALFASFFFGSWAELRDDGTESLTGPLGDALAVAGLRAVAVLRAAVVFAVVFVAIKKF
jgi:hypothetical protein